VSLRLASERLQLRPLDSRDAPSLFAYRSDPDVARYQGWSPSEVSEAEAFIARQAAAVPNTPGSWLQLGIYLKTDDALIGDLGLHTPADEPLQAEFGITLSPAYQGHGYATEALKAAFAYLFGDCGKHRVFCSIDPRNLPSLAMAKRVGMRQEAHVLQSLWFKGEWVDDVVFGLLGSER
jgi:RimJ/RimL family protein N-acetyltransferase